MFKFCFNKHFKTKKSSTNMKSAVSSSSSGSEKGDRSHVVSSVGYVIEENKSKSNSRMSCASDDSCAINELLEGRMDLNVTLPNSANSVVFNVERRTPMLDLLVNIATQYRFNAANYTISAGDHEFKASTPIGSLDVNEISIIQKQTKSASVKREPSGMPFQTTFRLQVNLPRNQLMVLRVTPNASIAAIKQIICSEKSLDSSKYQLVRFAGNNEGPQILEHNKTLAYYTLNEVTLVSNKILTQIEMQFGAPTTSQVDLSNSRTNSTSVATNKKAIHSLLISQSNPDFTTIDDNTVLNHTNSKPIKKRQAPPPPISFSMTSLNRSESVQINCNKNDNNITNSENDDSKVKTAVSETFIEAKPVPKSTKIVANHVSHVRHNSGSDSSGYHESVLSSDSPESSSAVATLQKSNNNNNMNNNLNNKLLNNKTANKKRRAPPPPTTANTDQIEVSGDRNNDKATVECLSDVSLPLSISSSSASDSSGTASSINTRSLSPIVITQTNGSSTPIRTSMNSSDVPIEPSSQADVSPEYCLSSQITVIDENSEQLDSAQMTESDNEKVNISEANLTKEAHFVEEVLPNKLSESLNKTRTEPIMCQQIDNQECNNETVDQNEMPVAINDRNDSDVGNCSEPITAMSTKSDEEPLLKEVEVSSAPALALSHDNDLSGHECVERVEERDKSNIDSEKQGVNRHNSTETAINFNKDCESDPIQNFIQTDIGDCEPPEMSSPLPPPSPFRNSNADELNSSDGNDSEVQLGQGVPQINSSSSDSSIINQTKYDMTIVEQKVKDQLKNSDTIESRIGDTIESTINENTSDMYKNGGESEMTTPSIVSDEDMINKEIEVTLQSLNDELDRLDSQESEDKDSNNEQLISNYRSEDNYLINESNQINKNIEHLSNNNSTKVSVQVKQTDSNYDFETNKIKFDDRKTPSPTPRILSSVNGKSKVTMNRNDPKTQVSKSSNGKTKLLVNKSQSFSPPASPQPQSMSPIPADEKLTVEKLTDEVRQLCRPRVKLTNFSIGSYKKEVDIFEETQKGLKSEPPATAPVISVNRKPSLNVNKPFVVTASVKQEKSGNQLNQNKTKVNITANSTTTNTTARLTTPVIQTLITTAPKINRIQSWSGHKSVSLDQKGVKLPVKTNERFVSQIAINKDHSTNQQSEETELESPKLLVQKLIARTESEIRNRSPSPQNSSQKVQSTKEHTTISIKPGLEAIIRSQNTTIKSENETDSIQKLKSNKSSKQSITIDKIEVQLKSNQTIKANIESNPSEQSLQPLIPPPIPPPLPPLPLENTSLPSNESSKLSKTNVNTKLFATRGWKSEKVQRNGAVTAVPKVKHVEPPNSSVDVRDALLNEIKSFGGKNTLKKVSKNKSWQLEVNGNTIKT